MDNKKEFKKGRALKVGEADEEGLTTFQRWYRNNREYAISMAGEWYRKNKATILARRKKEYYEAKLRKDGTMSKDSGIVVEFK